MTKTLRKSIPSFYSSCTMIHGEYGAGKTLLASQFPKPYFLMFENNNAYNDRLHMDTPKSWEDVQTLVAEFVKGDHDFKTLVIDNVENFYSMAMNYQIDEINKTRTKATDTKIKSLTDMNDFGVSYKTLLDSIKLILNAIDMSEKYNLVLVTHTVVKEEKTFSGDTFHKYVPELPSGKANEYFKSLAQNIFYCFHFKSQRFIKIIGDDLIMAKAKGDKKFLTTEGEHVINIPMGKNEQEAYKYLTLAYNNKFKRTFKNI